MSTAKNAILKTKIEGVIYEVMVKTNAANVYVDDNTTLAAKLSAILADIATKASTEEMNAALALKAEKSHTHEQAEVNGLVDLLATLATSQSVTDAIDALRAEIMGDQVNTNFDTFTELAKYIEEHEEAAEALNAAIGAKADKATTLAGYGITDAYTKGEVEQMIEDAVQDATGGESASEVKDALDAYKTSNDARVKAIEDDYLKAADKTELSEAISNGDATTLSQAKSYADGLAGNYDAKGSAAQALVDAKAYADGLAGNYDSKGSAAQALVDAKAYADGLAGNYDAAGAAATAEQNAKTYADGLNTAMGERVDAVSAVANGKSTIHFSETEPANLAAGDLWVALV